MANDARIGQHAVSADAFRPRDGNSPFGNHVNLRLGLQYTAYGKFDGVRHDYDGEGAKASDNNALRLYSWLAF